jgi:transposase
VYWRDGPAKSNQERIVSPYDQEARSCRKRETVWLGFKLHVTETCDQDPALPHLIVQVQTTPATIQDSEEFPLILQDLRRRDLAPGEVWVDQGYTCGPLLATQAQLGTVVLGPVPAPSCWQERQQGGYAPKDFELDWEQGVATCPQGQQSTNWKSRTDRRGHETLVIQFARHTCQSCAVREHCTTNPAGRSLTLNPPAAHQALQQRRAEQQTPEFGKRYALRAGIEGTISQAVRTSALRRSPYRGLNKTHLQHLAIAAGLNLVRLHTFLQRQCQGQPPRLPRPLSPLARLKERMAA